MYNYIIFGRQATIPGSSPSRNSTITFQALLRNSGIALSFRPVSSYGVYCTATPLPGQRAGRIEHNAHGSRIARHAIARA